MSDLVTTSPLLTPWYKDLKVQDFGEGNNIDATMGIPYLIAEAIRLKKPLYECADEGDTKLGVDEVYAFLESVGGFPIWKDLVPAYRSLWCWDDGIGYATVAEVEGGNKLTMRVLCFRKEIVDACRDFQKSKLQKRVTSGKIYVMVSSQTGLQLKSMGVAKEPLEPLNYPTEVVEDFNHVVSDLTATGPCGRISILDGDPGSGKTFLIRALLNSCTNGIFIMVPSNVVQMLGGPDVISLLINLKEENRHNAQPIILVLEDGDSALGVRGSDNMPLVSTLLNFGDGLFGQMLDTRIVATTNAKIEELDEAITRPGRLCRRIHVGKLKAAHANAVYQRLVGNDEEAPFEQDVVLAEVYREARKEAKASSKPKAKKAIGFGG